MSKAESNTVHFCAAPRGDQSFLVGLWAICSMNSASTYDLEDCMLLGPAEAEPFLLTLRLFECSTA
jgi:hypothetical protein